MKENNKWLDKIFIALGAILVIYYLCLKAFFGNIAFSNMFCLLGIILIIYGTAEYKFNISMWSLLPRGMRRMLQGIFIIGISLFIIIESIIIYSGHHYDLEKPDYLIVLGAGLRGSEISTTLLYRLNKAIEFNKIYPDVKIVVSGGQGKGEDLSEALAMKNYLVKNNINEDMIIMEDKSTNTNENFKFSKEKLVELTGKTDFKVTVITNDFHMYRACYLGEKFGLKCLKYPAKSHISSTLIFHVREFFGVMKAYFLGR